MAQRGVKLRTAREARLARSAAPDDAGVHFLHVLEEFFPDGLERVLLVCRQVQGFLHLGVLERLQALLLQLAAQLSIAGHDADRVRPAANAFCSRPNTAIAAWVEIN